MGAHQLLILFKSFVIDAARLFSRPSSAQENTADQSPPNPPAPVVGNNLPHERNSGVVPQLIPSSCTSFEGEELKVIGSTPIGAGGYADIWEATHGGRAVVLKSYRLYETDDIGHTARRHHRETLACNQLSHPNVVPVVGELSTPNHPLSLVLDTAGDLGLREYLNNNPGANKLKLVRGIARGLKHVHDLGIVHGRLGSNILVSPDGTPRIAGFGSCFTISRPDSWSADIASFHRGSAPELLRPPEPGKPDIRTSKASDMYAFGMLTWEIFSEEGPFSRDLDATVVGRVLSGDRPPRPNRAGPSNQVWKMVKACWHDSPSRRMTVDEVVEVLDAE